jgi:hypothetical protein
MFQFRKDNLTKRKFLLEKSKIFQRTNKFLLKEFDFIISYTSLINFKEKDHNSQ